MAYRRGRRRRSVPRSDSYYSTPPTPEAATPKAVTYIDAGSVHDAYKWWQAHCKSDRVANWTGNRSWGAAGLSDEQIVTACTQGLTPDPELVPSETQTDWLPARLQTRMGRKKYWGVGAPMAWNVPSLIAGTPDYALQCERRPTEGAVVNLIVSGTVSAGVPSDDLIRRAAAICNAVRDISAFGRAVEVYLSVDLQSSKCCEGPVSVRLKVKAADEATDTSLLFFWLGHTAALRAILYPYVETVMRKDADNAQPTYDGNYVGYQSPVNPHGWPDDPGTAVIPCVYTGDPDWQSRIQTVIVGAFGTEEATV